MDVVRAIKPGDKGSQRFVKKYGERLVAVRYRKNGRRPLKQERQALGVRLSECRCPGVKRTR